MTYDSRKSGFDKLRAQFNIDVIVGNGFDIAWLKHLKDKKKITGDKTTKYSDFFDYETAEGIPESKNIILKLMKDKREKGVENWSDIELAILEKCKKRSDLNAVAREVKEIQLGFADFLNSFITPKVLLNTFEIANESHLNLHTFSGFTSDVSKASVFNASRQLEFSDLLNHYDSINYSIFNLNYTFLLDNYLAMNEKNYDPHPYKFAKQNFKFILPEKSAIHEDQNTAYSDHLNYKIFHPHGHVGIPKSILLGIDNIDQIYDEPVEENERYAGDHKTEQQLSKTYMAEDNLKYKPMMDEAALFIVFGTSLGETDTWWYREIISRMEMDVQAETFMIDDHDDSMLRRVYKPETVIYWYVSADVLGD